MSSIFEILSTVDRLLADAVSSFAQEIMVMVAFFVSYWSWRFVKSRHMGANRATSKLRSSFDVSSSPPPATRIPTSRSSPRMSNSAGYRAKTAAVVVPPPVKAAEKKMLQRLEQREFTQALNMYRSLERDGRDQYFSEELFSAFVQSAIRVGKVDMVERMFKTMRRNDTNPSLQFWQSTLKMLSSRRHFSICLSLHGLYGKHVPADKTIYSCLINAALEVAMPEKALALLERYSESGIEARDYVLCFRTYAALGDANSAEACFRKLGSETTTLMLNQLLLTCVQGDDPNRAQRILGEAHALPAKEAIVDTVSYNTVIKGYAKQGNHGKCFACLREMLAHGVEPDDVTFGTLLDACIVDNQLGAANDVVSLFVARDKPMDTVMSTLFMKGLVRANCLPKAMELYEEMKRREKAHPDIVTYSVLMKALVDNKELDRALQLMDDMVKAGLQPDDIILTHLLEGCRIEGNHVLGKKLFEDMVELGVKPSEFTLVTMLELHGRVGAHQEAYDLVNTWEANFGSQPCAFHYTCVMSGCLRSKEYDQAFAAYELMCKRGVTPDVTTISTLVPGLVVAQQWERVLTVVRRALKAETPVPIPTETLNSALYQMRAAAGARYFADQLMRLMQECGVPVTARNAKRAT